MKIIYETPNKEYAIVEQTDPEWQAVFGTDAVYYNAVKISTKSIIYTGISVPPVLKWLRKFSVISEDEMNYQIKKIGK
jgi:hypothetical protein